MYIKEVSIDGFKSYAQRVTLSNFDPGFNAITGLNGSGKSNILDSICFVMGIKNLAQARGRRGRVEPRAALRRARCAARAFKRRVLPRAAAAASRSPCCGPCSGLQVKHARHQELCSRQQSPAQGARCCATRLRQRRPPPTSARPRRPETPPQVRAGSLQELVYKQGSAGITKASVSITFHNDDPANGPSGYEDKELITVTRQVGGVLPREASEGRRRGVAARGRRRRRRRRCRLWIQGGMRVCAGVGRRGPGPADGMHGRASAAAASAEAEAAKGEEARVSSRAAAAGLKRRRPSLPLLICRS
jgi:hypothetical protein